MKSSAVPPSKELKVEKLLKAPLKKKRESVCVCTKRKKTAEHAKKNPRFSSLKKKGGLGRRLNPTTCEGKKKKKSDKKRMPNRISGGKAVVSTLQLCKTGAENEGDGKKKTALRACQQS